MLQITPCYLSPLYKTKTAVNTRFSQLAASNVHCRYYVYHQPFITVVNTYSCRSCSMLLRNFAPSFKLRSPYFTNACM